MQLLSGKEENSAEEESEVDQELEALAEEVMRKYLGSVRADIRSRAIESDFEEIVAEKIEIPEDIQRVLEEVPAERISPAETMRERINETIEKLNELIKSSRENLKGVIVEQYTRVRKHVREVGSMVALAVVSKIGALHLRHKIQAIYKDIIENELKTRENQIIKDTLTPLELFFRNFIQHVSELSEHILGLREAYEKWLVEYGTVLRDFIEEESGASEIEELLQKNQQLKSQLAGLEKDLEKCSSENLELRMKINELERHLREKTEELAAQLRAEYESKIEGYTKEIMHLQQKLADKEKEINDLVNKMRALEKEFLKMPGLEELKKIYEQRLEEKDKLIEQLKSELDARVGSRELVDKYKEVYSKYISLSEENRLLKGEIEGLKKENDKLRTEISKLKDKLSEAASLEEIRRVYEQKLSEKETEITALKNKIVELQESLATLEGLRKEFEAIKDLVGKPTTTVSPEVPMEGYKRILEDLKNEIISLREQLVERQRKAAELEAKVKVYEDQINLLQEQLMAYKRGISISDQEFTELKRENLALKERLRVLEERSNELSRNLEAARREPEELKKVLSETPLGRIYLQLRTLRRASIELLARALGMPRPAILRELQVLAKMGLVKLTENQAIYQG